MYTPLPTWIFLMINFHVVTRLRILYSCDFLDRPLNEYFVQ